MFITTQIKLLPEQLQNDTEIRRLIIQKLSLNKQEISGYRILKRSIDARSKRVYYSLTLEVYVNETPLVVDLPTFPIQNVENAPIIPIIGAGPAGLFAALRLIELGFCPLILERGKDVRSRRRDIARLNKEHIVNPDSNYCFGEGGAGTYSDGKLYTRSKKRGDTTKVLEWLVAHGADYDILIDAHPHIGTNKLPNVISQIRQSILEAGGLINFGTKVVDFIIENQQIQGVLADKGVKIATNHLILATGHSARDVYRWFFENDFLLENKSFALGVRVEHPQNLIDSIQYSCSSNGRGPYLPPASYRLVHQQKGNKKHPTQRGTYSFCMCPGGIIAPCATDAGEVVTNGWSPSRRNNPFANSGMVVEVKPEDLKPFEEHGVLAGMYFQSSVEQKAWLMGGKTQTAPAQRMVDFVSGKVSTDLPKCSYFPGVRSVAMDEVLPPAFNHHLRNAFKAFGKKMKGYFTNEAIIVGVESRTSSPVKIPRDKTTLMHPQIKGLYPCGEGAGYAGGIVSACIDGMRCADQIVHQYSM